VESQLGMIRGENTMPDPRRERQQRFSNCSTPKPLASSGFFLKKKPPFAELVRIRGLENRSRRA
jgi:hypothetical protein